MKNLRELLNQPETKSETETSEGVRLVVSPAAEEKSTFTVNVGMLGNMRTITLDRERTYTVNDVLNKADMSAGKYEIRMGGKTVDGNAPVTLDHSTILLLHAIKGNG